MNHRIRRPAVLGSIAAAAVALSLGASLPANAGVSGGPSYSATTTGFQVGPALAGFARAFNDVRATVTFPFITGARSQVNLLLEEFARAGADVVIVARRASELDIAPVVQGERDKLAGLNRLLAATGVVAADCAYMGDDWPDLPVMAQVGFAAAVADAAPEVRRAAHWIAQADGGRGAVRALAEFLLLCRQRHPMPGPPDA